jgi:hypothetical protein
MEPVPNDSKKLGFLSGGGGGDRISSKRQQTAWPSIWWRGWVLKVGKEPVPSDNKKRGLLYGGGGGDSSWRWNLFQTTTKSVAVFTILWVIGHTTFDL